MWQLLHAPMAACHHVATTTTSSCDAQQVLPTGNNKSPTSYRMLEQVAAPAVAADRGRTFMATPECNPAFNTASHLQHHHHHHHQRWQRYAASGLQLVFIQLPERHHGWQLATTAARESSTDAAIPSQSTCNIEKPLLRHWAPL
ncbi:hypothetical protein ACLKA6_004621 [Drosophila palustris]